MQSGNLATFGSIAMSAIGTVAGAMAGFKLLLAPIKVDIVNLKEGQALILEYVLKK